MGGCVGGDLKADQSMSRAIRLRRVSLQRGAPMWKVRLLSCIVCLAVFSAGCGGKPTLLSVNKDWIQILNEFTDALDSVNDQVTADKAKEKINALAVRASAVMKQFKELEKTAQSTEKEAATKQLIEAMKASNDKLMQIMKSKHDSGKQQLLAPLLREFAKFTDLDKSN